MKFYFDNLDMCSSNHEHLTSYKNFSYWLVAPGAPIKKEAQQAGIEIELLENIDSPGCYVIDVNGNPNWWLGLSQGYNFPETHILENVNENILNLAREKKIRIVIAADREGGPMQNKNFDGFEKTNNVIKKLKLPPQSVLITFGNKKIEQQHTEWLLANKKRKKLFEVMYSNHFGKICIDHTTKLPKQPIILEAIKNEKSKDFNSLNRVYRPHRGAHLYNLAKNKLLDNGIVSANEIQLGDANVNLLLNEDNFISVMTQHYPRFVDGNWAEINAANQINFEIYKSSLMSFITETIFFDNVAFVTEKIFKPIIAGHPLILLASQGTLQALKDLGFKTNWCGIDPAYNDIKDDKLRFEKTHDELYKWIALSKEDKHRRILDSIETIEHNFNLIKTEDFYHNALREIAQRSEKYFESK